MPSLRLYYSALVVVQIIFGLNFTASKYIVERIDPLMWAQMRFLVSSLLLLGFALFKRRKWIGRVDKNFFFKLILFSCLGFLLPQVLLLKGLTLTSSIHSSVITSFGPIFVLLIVYFKGLEAMHPIKFFGMFISFLGLILMQDLGQFALDSSLLWGDLLVLFGSLAFSLYLSFAKDFLMEYDHLWMTGLMFFVSQLLLIPFNCSSYDQLFHFQWSGEVFIAAFYSVVFATFLTYLLSNWLLTKIPSANIALFLYLQPLVATAAGVLILGESLELLTVMCATLVFIGLIINVKVDEGL